MRRTRTAHAESHRSEDPAAKLTAGHRRPAPALEAPTAAAPFTRKLATRFAKLLVTRSGSCATEATSIRLHQHAPCEAGNTSVAMDAIRAIGCHLLPPIALCRSS